MEAAVLWIGDIWYGSVSGSGSADPYHWLTDWILLFSSVALQMPQKGFFISFLFFIFIWYIYISLSSAAVAAGPR